MVTVVGFIMLLVIVVLLLWGKISLPPIFVVCPVLAALICGFSIQEINGFLSTGLSSVLNTVALFTFAVLYFSILNDVGMFDVIVQKVMRYLGNKVELVLLMTAFVATISHLDGSGATTMLVTIPMMLPLYNKMKIRREALLLFAALASGSMNMTPWCSSVMRLSAATSVDGYELWKFVLPLQAICLLITYLLVIPIGRIERKNGAGMSDEEFKLLKSNLMEPVEIKVSKKVLYFDMAFTVVLMIALLLGWVKANLGFMIALCVALLVNYPDVKTQSAKIKQFGGTALNMVMIIFSIGCLVGIMKDSGMIQGMADAILSVMPTSMGSHLTWLLSALSVPLSIIIGSDTVYLALAPILVNVVTVFGSTILQLCAALLIGSCLAANLCLVGPTPYLALGLADVNMASHLKYSFKWVFGMGLVVSVIAGILGIIPF